MLTICTRLSLQKALLINNKAESRDLFCGYFVPVFRQKGKKIVHYFLNTQRIFKQ